MEDIDLIDLGLEVQPKEFEFVTHLFYDQSYTTLISTPWTFRLIPAYLWALYNIIPYLLHMIFIFLVWYYIFPSYPFFNPTK